MNDVAVGWVAGIIEGEGWIGYGSGKHLGRIQVNSNDEDVIDRLHHYTGMGRVYRSRKRKAGNDYHSWVVSKQNEVKFILHQIRPYMLSRRAEKIDEVMDAMGQQSESRIGWIA